MRQLFASFGMVGLLLILAAPTVQAASTQAHLSITKAVCVVDVVQDGNGQTLRTPEGECQVLLPNLLFGPTLGAVQDPPVELPFAGQAAVGAPLQPRPVGALTSANSNGVQIATGVGHFVESAATVGIIAAVTGVALDVVLFEFSYTPRLGNWLRQRIVRWFKF